MTKHHSLQRWGILLAWILIWQVAAVIIDNSIIFAAPADVLQALARLLPTSNFWLSLVRSFGRISVGFLGAFLSGTLIGSLAFFMPPLRAFLEPLMVLIRSVPVASFVILALIWIGSENLSIFISFLVVFPILYANTITGLEHTNPQLLEMAQVFSIRFSGKIRCIYLPALFPYLVSGCRSALGMSWKSGVAAEVIGVPANSIGENLYMAKIYLETADLFAWTLIIILASTLFEKLFLWLLQEGGKQWFHSA